MKNVPLFVISAVFISSFTSQQVIAAEVREQSSLSTKLYSETQEEEITISEEEANKLLSLGPYGVSAAVAGSVGILAAGIITIPFVYFTIGGLCHSFNKRSLELVALDDPRFALFRHIWYGDLEEAEEEFKNNRIFFKALSKTERFKKELYAVDEFALFFIEKQLLPQKVPTRHDVSEESESD